MTYMINRILSEENRKKYSQILFYVALSIELFLMILEKSEILFEYESYVFRVTFLLTFLAVIIMKHDRKQWVVIAVIWCFTTLCYRLSGKNDLLRIATFMMATRDIDLKKAMKYSFFVSIAGFLVIAALALFGFLGDVVLIADYGRGIADESRLVLGFGHPNTLLGCVYVLVLMWLWIYGENASLIKYGLVIILSILFSLLTRSRTGILMLFMTLAIALILRITKNLKSYKLPYIISFMVTPVFCMTTAVFAGLCAEGEYTTGGIGIPVWVWRMDVALNYRISNLYYSVPEHGGIASNWKLFAGRGADGYFDMGWVRLFYWYGIVPTVLIAVAVALVIYVCYKKKDIWSVLITLSVSVYTIIEATFVSRYIGRAFYLLIAGVYLCSLFKGKIDE
ncbi:MAG: hypothetical protein E7305_02410 [Butyrivibrio sp.]|nr:hypothetical protein [Butyrivibrio sp.]